MKSAFISLVGRPSSGKSTLLNRLCSSKVSIISPVPQTTRNKIRGIINTRKGQLVFIDTPGFHTSEKKLNLLLTGLVKSSLEEVDMVLYLIDPSRPLGPEERTLMGILSKFQGSLIVALNKADMRPPYGPQVLTKVRQWRPGAPVLTISALTGEGVEHLVATLFELAPEGDRLYPEDFYTDQEPEFRISEIIREKALNKTYQELPHAIYVEIADTQLSKDVLWVRAFLCVERPSQRGILVGRGGSKIGEIRRESLEELRQLFEYRIKLDLRVKVRPRWRRKDSIIRRLVR
jgi:GTP-binding protein Era